MAELRVTVTDGDESLTGAAVSLEGNGERYVETTKYTGNTVRAVFEDIPNGQYDIRVVKPYYTIETGTVSVSGTVSRTYYLDPVDGPTTTRVSPDDGRTVFPNMQTGDYYVIIEDDTLEPWVSYESLDDSGRQPIYHLREIRSNLTVRVEDEDGNALENAIVQIGTTIHLTDSTGETQFTVDNDTHTMIVSHPNTSTYVEELDVTSATTRNITLQDSDPDRNPPSSSVTFIAQAKIGQGESIEVTVEQNGSQDTINLSNGFNEIPIDLPVGTGYRWSATFEADTVEKTPRLFFGDIHVGGSSVGRRVGIETADGSVVAIPVYEPDTIPKPQIRFDTNAGVLAARLRSPSSTDVLRVEVGGSEYGVEI